MAEPVGGFGHTNQQKKKPSEWMTSLLVTRTGIEPILPP